MVWKVLCAVVLLSACSGTNDPTSASGLTLPLPGVPDTLLPVPNDTQPPDVTETLPSDALFGGDLCSALTEQDFAGVGLAGRGPGRLTDSGALSADSCQYLLSVGGRDYEVVVQVQSQSDFLNPGIPADVIDEINGLGLAARGVLHTTDTGTTDTGPTDTGPTDTGTTDTGTTDTGTTDIGEEYEVIVKVENGFFSVTSPDKASALALAAKAEPRALPA